MKTLEDFQSELTKKMMEQLAVAPELPHGWQWGFASELKEEEAQITVTMTAYPQRKFFGCGDESCCGIGVKKEWGK